MKNLYSDPYECDKFENYFGPKEAKKLYKEIEDEEME